MESDEIKCPQCSSIVDKNLTFCPKCGHKIKFESITDKIYTIYQEKQDEESVESRKSKPWYGFAGIILIVTSIILFLFVGITKWVIFIFIVGASCIYEAFSKNTNEKY